MSPLAEVQTWLFTYITTPGPDGGAVQAAEAAAGIRTGSAERLVRATSRLTAQQQIRIYRDMYRERMEIYLRTDFPRTHRCLGGLRFAQLVKEYLQVHPSRSWTLHYLGRDFPDFLAQAAWLGRRRAFLADLARLEWAMCASTEAPDSPVLTRADLAGLDPATFEARPLRPIASLRLLALRYPVNSFVRNGGPEPRRLNSWVVVWRGADYVTWSLDLSRPTFELLGALAEGLPLSEAIALTLRRRQVSQAELGQFVAQAIADGLFSKP